MYRFRVDGRKRRFSNTMTLFRSHIRFENVTSGRRLFLHTDGRSPFSKIPGNVCKIKYDSKTLVWTQIFLNTEKKSPFSKIPGHAWTGSKKQISIGNKNCHFLTVCYCTSVYRWSVLGSRVGLLPINKIVSVLWFLTPLVRIGRWEILPGCPLCNVWLDCIPLINFQSNQSSLN